MTAVLAEVTEVTSRAKPWLASYPAGVPAQIVRRRDDAPAVNA